MKSLGQILGDGGAKRIVNKYVSREFQDYGYRLASELDDLTHKALYIRLAKTVPRALLEAARAFAVDSKARRKGALFMWKLKQLKTEVKKKMVSTG